MFQFNVYIYLYIISLFGCHLTQFNCSFLDHVPCAYHILISLAVTCPIYTHYIHLQQPVFSLFLWVSPSLCLCCGKQAEVRVYMSSRPHSTHSQRQHIGRCISILICHKILIMKTTPQMLTVHQTVIQSNKHTKCL